MNRNLEKHLALTLLKITYIVLIEHFNAIQEAKNNRMLFCTSWYEKSKGRENCSVAKSKWKWGTYISVLKQLIYLIWFSLKFMFYLLLNDFFKSVSLLEFFSSCRSGNLFDMEYSIIRWAILMTNLAEEIEWIGGLDFWLCSTNFFSCYLS